jgi:hypothetical protein
MGKMILDAARPFAVEVGRQIVIVIATEAVRRLRQPK